MIPEIGKIYRNIWNQYVQIVKIESHTKHGLMIHMMVLGIPENDSSKYEFLFANVFEKYYREEVW